MLERTTRPQDLIGGSTLADTADFSTEIAWRDHKIAYVTSRCRRRKVLDLGCVQHNPENYRSRYWVHRAIKEAALSVVGVDLSLDGVLYLRNRGYDVRCLDAQCFSLQETFEVIHCGDLMEHLEDFHGFFTSCRKHLAPGGTIIISTPNPWYWKNIARAVLHPEVKNNPEHTCWLCPRTLRQLAARHELEVCEVEFGSRYLRDRMTPLPRGVKHTSFHAVLRPVPSGHSSASL